jgi:hypothetical protein
MRVILINPWNQTVSDTEYSGTWTDFYRLLSGPTAEGLPDAKVSCMDITTLVEARDHQLVVDDVGYVNGEPQAYFRMDGRTFAGRGIVIASDDSGDTAEPQLTAAEIAGMVTFLPTGVEVMPERAVVTSFDTFDELLTFLDDNRGGMAQESNNVGM